MLAFKCTGCSRLTSLDEIEVSADDEQFCRRCAEERGEVGSFERSIADASRERAARYVEAKRERGEPVAAYCRPGRLREEGCAVCEGEAARAGDRPGPRLLEERFALSFDGEAMMPTSGDTGEDWP